MKVYIYIGKFTILFCLTFVIMSATSYLWTLIANGVGVVNWRNSIISGLFFGILFQFLLSIKKCPDCAKAIKLEAKVCRFCGKKFNDKDID